MRYWEPPEGHRADLIVSELFGSFGDNEMAPELLDGAQRLLKGIALKLIITRTGIIIYKNCIIN